ncbi:MAG: hypothetical protein HC831_14295 [Chloroflexia bacterium]|nr:hypothetical protein [Chloroflexia bacterium]
MKKLLLFIGILCSNHIGFAQVKIDRERGDISDGIPVFQGKINVSTSGRTFSYAFAQGDVVLIKFSTYKEKKLNQARFYNEYRSNLWQNVKIASANQQINITKEGVYSLELDGRGLGGREVTLDIIRKPGSQKDFNNSLVCKYYSYKSKDVNYSVDSVIGYKKPVITIDTLQVFDKYLYQNIELVNHKSQILAQMGIHNSQAKPFKLGIDPNKVPKNAKLKGYTYSLSSVLGGAKHWAIADVTVTVGAMFLTPAAGFAAHGAMALLGPQPGNEPVQYFLTDHESDLNVVREIYSPHNVARGVTNVYKDGVGELAGLFSGKAKKAVKGTKVHVYNEGELHYDQKGKVTNMLIFSAEPPSKDLMILANPDYAQAKNIKLKGSAIYYAPKFNMVKAKQYYYDLDKVQLSKTTKVFTRTVSFSSIKE